MSHLPPSCLPRAGLFIQPPAHACRFFGLAVVAFCCLVQDLRGSRSGRKQDSAVTLPFAIARSEWNSRSTRFALVTERTVFATHLDALGDSHPGALRKPLRSAWQM
jgi:hypothetical protein